jgi:hypothetical protein
MAQALTCPQCNAPLTPHPFSRSVVCSFCGTTVRLDGSNVVSVAVFHEAFRAWNSPASYQLSSWASIGDRHWGVDRLIAHGDITDVYAGRRARWPSELVILKILRDSQNAGLLENEWVALQSLQQSQAPGADTFTGLLPQPIAHARITSGLFSGQWASIFRWASGFYYTFEDVRRVYPQGIPPRASIWIWRRILEVLSFIHASGVVHGAVVPAHLLVQKNEHGVRLVGYSRAGRPGETLRAVSSAYEPFYPQPAGWRSNLTPQLDIVMSARCIAAILGGDPASASLPAAAPKKLADLVRQIGLSQPGDTAIRSAWAIREELGRVAKDVFGPSQFIPVVMPPE